MLVPNRTNKYYNDSKATNTLATQFALNSFNQPIIWLCGGLDRGNEFDELIPLYGKCSRDGCIRTNES